MFEDKSLNWVPRELDNSRWVGLGNWTSARDNFKWHQLAEGYTVPVDLIFGDSVVPEQRSLPYKDQRDAEAETKEKENEHTLHDLRRAGESARILRHWAQRNLQSGQNLYEFSLKAEDNVQKNLGWNSENISKRGFANPLGINVNNVVSQNILNDKSDLKYTTGDTCTFEFATNYNGHIAANTFTLCEDENYKNLVLASKEAVETGIKMVGIDARCNEVAEAMLEVVKSQECRHEGADTPVLPITNICGQRMGRQRLDDEKTMWFTKDKLAKNSSDKFQEGESWSVRLGAVVGGKGEVKSEGDVTMFAHKQQHQPKSVRIKTAQKLFNHIENNQKNMQGSLRQLEAVEMRNTLTLRNLQELGMIDLHCPLVEKKNSKTAIFEHTVYLKHHSGVEVITSGDDL